MPEENPPPVSPPPEPKTNADAEAFANDYADMRAQQEEDHTLLHQMASALENFFGLQESAMNENEQPDAQSSNTPRQAKEAKPTPAGPKVEPTSPARIPDTPPEELHWYWRKRFTFGKRGK